MRGRIHRVIQTFGNRAGLQIFLWVESTKGFNLRTKMNWLAHLYLSEPTPEFRVGNLLPDLTGADKLAALPEAYQQGIRRHRRIDLFTDTHPLVKVCVRRFSPPYRRFGSILTDVYFDYFLARDWQEYSDLPLREFIASCYRDIEICGPAIPDEADRCLRQMREEDWLGSYHEIAGIANILERMGRRLRFPSDLAGSLPSFQAQEGAFLADFRVFFLELMADVNCTLPASK
jgi:acyl carrier protein phosphodiesterase